MSAAGSIRRALALLEAASADCRLTGPSNGSDPLWWPIATVAARAQLQHALEQLSASDALLTAAADHLHGWSAGAEPDGALIRRMRALASREAPGAAHIDADAELGMTWWNGLSERERAEWLRIADSAAPADAWRAYKAAKEVPAQKRG
jgi:hypothetical protein